nr:TPM domain-containing protein [Streptomyces coryli]
MRIRRLRYGCAVLGALGTLLLQGASAPLVDPVTLDKDGQITDEVGALGSRRGEVATALEDLDKSNNIQLYVAYVRNFAGRGGQSWADATAEKNGLGQNDILLAVATRDRQYATSAATDSGLTEDQIQQVNAEAIEPALRQNDWAGAAIGGADGIAAVLDGKPIPKPEITPGPANPGGGTGAEQFTASDALVPVLAVGGAAVAAGYLFSPKRRKRRQEGGGWGRSGPQLTPLPALDSQARTLLVETDDAIRTSSEELGFASAQFGEEASKPFNDAIGYAKGELTAAFRLRQQLDDAYPEDDATKRKMLDEIIARCTDANRRLDAESAAFDQLRAMVTNAPEVLANAEAAAERLPQRINDAEVQLTGLGQAYASSAFAAVANNPREAKDRFQFAAKNLTQARTALTGGDRNITAVHVRAAEGAIEQCDTLTDAVLRRANELQAAAAKVEESLRDMQADLADARGMVSGTNHDVSTADLQGRIARAETVLAEVQQSVAAGPYDPLDTLRRIEEADAALEEALSGAREQAAAERKARGLLDQALLAARSEVAAARDFITTHRGGIGSSARTRLHEAQRHLQQAESFASADATSALQHAQQADSLAQQARELAERDVYGGYGSGYGRMGGMGGGGRF